MPDPVPVPHFVRLLTLAISLGILISAVIGAGLAMLLPLFVSDQRAALGLFGFEIVAIVAAVLGILLARGRFAESPGMALACIGGTVLLSSALGWQAAGRQLGGMTLTPFLALRGLAAIALLAAAAFCTLRLEPRSWRPAIVGAALGAPVPLAAAAYLYGPSRRMIEAIVGDSPLLLTLGAIGAVVVLGGLLAASVHLIISAFEQAADRQPQ
jgi:hypothetical protein